jgi:hypothetical protein
VQGRSVLDSLHKYLPPSTPVAHPTSHPSHSRASASCLSQIGPLVALPADTSTCRRRHRVPSLTGKWVGSGCTAMYQARNIHTSVHSGWYITCTHTSRESLSSAALGRSLAHEQAHGRMCPLVTLSSWHRHLIVARAHRRPLRRHGARKIEADEKRQRSI